MSAKSKSSGSKSGKATKAIDTHKLFVHAEGFRLAVEMLRKEVAEGKTIFLSSFHMNDAFCCELYLKLLATIQTGKHPYGHYLDDLFSQIPPKDQDRVEHHFNELSKHDLAYKEAGNTGPSKACDLGCALKDGKNLFADIRYWYEGNFPWSRGDFRWPVMAIRKVILEIHPHWTPKVENWLKPKSAKHQTPGPRPLEGSILPVHTPPIIALRKRR